LDSRELALGLLKAHEDSAIESGSGELKLVLSSWLLNAALKRRSTTVVDQQEILARRAF